MPELPPLSPNLQRQQDFYRFKFLPDGYPGRDDGWAHPIYGVYVLNDYLEQHHAKPTAELTQALSTVAHAAVDRMDAHHGALAFWYEPNPERGARLYERHYSGLTQSYYAKILQRTGKRLNDVSLIDAARRCFESLTIPVDDGGVLHEGPHGPAVAELPQQPASWILNGWQSALINIHAYALATGSVDAYDLLGASGSAMAEMLPLYDIPDLANSRYGLTGFTYLRINPPSADVSVTDVTLAIPGAESVPVSSSKGTRWQNYFLEADTVPVQGGVAIRGSARLNVVLSLVSAPQPNRLEFTFHAPRVQNVKIDIYLGDYNPLAAGPVNSRWEPLTVVSAEPGRRLSVEIPQETIEKVVSPTNFMKKFEGKQVNIYHPIHIRHLRQLGELVGRQDMVEWSQRWKNYVCSWSRMALYDGLFVRSLDLDRNEIHEPSRYCDAPRVS